MAQKYARIFVRSPYLFQDAYSFEKQIMSEEKYTSIFSRKVEAIVFIILQIFCKGSEKMFTNSPTVYSVGCFLLGVPCNDFMNRKLI